MNLYAKQMPLPLSYRADYSREDFIVSACNQEALTWIDTPQKWPSKMLLLLAEEGSGKTHLAHIFSKNVFEAKNLSQIDTPLFSSSFAIEDIDDPQVNEETLFHLYNNAQNLNCSVLFTAKAMPFWKLPDLKTRMNTIPQVKIKRPDDSVLMSLLLKGMNERELNIESDVIDYILKHIERSFSTTKRFIELAQQISFAQKRAITIPLAKQVLEKIAQEH